MVGNFKVAQNMVGNLWWGILKTLPLFLFLFLSLPPPPSFSPRPLYSLSRSVCPFLRGAPTACFGNHGGEFMVGNFGAPRIMVGNLGIPHHAWWGFYAKRHRTL